MQTDCLYRPLTNIITRRPQQWPVLEMASLSMYPKDGLTAGTGLEVQLVYDQDQFEVPVHKVREAMDRDSPGLLLLTCDC